MRGPDRRSRCFPLRRASRAHDERCAFSLACRRRLPTEAGLHRSPAARAASARRAGEADPRRRCRPPCAPLYEGRRLGRVLWCSWSGGYASRGPSVRGRRKGNGGGGHGRVDGRLRGRRLRCRPNVYVGPSAALQRAKVRGRHRAGSRKRRVIKLPGWTKCGRQLLEVIRRKPRALVAPRPLRNRAREIAGVSHDTTSLTPRATSDQWAAVGRFRRRNARSPRAPPDRSRWKGSARTVFHLPRLQPLPNSARSTSSQSSATLPTVSRRSSNSS